MSDRCTKCGTELIYRRATGNRLFLGHPVWHDSKTGDKMYAAERACPKKRRWWDGHFLSGEGRHGAGFGFLAAKFDKDGIYRG